MKNKFVYIGEAARIIRADTRTARKYLKAAGTDPAGRKYYRRTDAEKIRERTKGRRNFHGRPLLRGKKVTRSE